MTQFGSSPRSSSPLWKKIERQAAVKRTTIETIAPNVYARAIVTAAKMFGEDPIQIAIGRYHVNGRYIAFYALVDDFPTMDQIEIAKYVGAKRPDAFVKKAERGRTELVFVDETKITEVRHAVAIERLT